MKPVWSTSLLAGMILWCAGDVLALAEVKSDASMEALRWAKQAEASGVARDQVASMNQRDSTLLKGQMGPTRKGTPDGSFLN